MTRPGPPVTLTSDPVAVRREVADRAVLRTLAPRPGRSALHLASRPAHHGAMTAATCRTGPVSRDVLIQATERALRAPSVHNSQPWQWRIADGAVQLYADSDRHLVGTDPDRRDLVISCGAALHHVRVALADLGVSTTTDRFPEPGDSTLLAVVHAVDGPIDTHDAALAGWLDERRSDRRAFREQPVQPPQLELLAAHAATEGADLVPVLREDARARLAVVLGEAATRERAVPGYATELAMWSRRHAGGHDGIPSGSRTGRGVGPEGAGLRQFPEGRLSQTPHPLAAGPDGATLMVLTTPGDGPADWLRAGEATSAVLLAATKLGLATTVLSQAAEVASTRRQLADTVLRVPEHAQLILRVGWALAGAATLPETPRRSLRSVLLG